MTDDVFISKLIQKNEQKARELRLKKQQEKTEKLLEKSGLGEKFKKRTFKTFQVTEDNKEAYKTCAYFAKNFDEQNRGILLSGDAGLGKTHLAAAIANYLIRDLYRVMFGNVVNLINLIRSTYKRDAELSEKEILDIMADADLLVIDDLGKENTSDNNLKLIYQMINDRYENERLLVITTNLTSAELKQKFGKWTYSRLIEMCKPIKMQGPDWRLKKCN